MKHSFFKVVGTLCLVAAIGASPVFSQGKGETAGSVKSDKDVTEFTFAYADGDELKINAMNKVLEKFSAQRDDIKILVQPANGMSYEEFIKTKDSVGEFPDVMEIRGAASMYIRAGKFAEIPESITDRFLSPVYIDGKIYTVALNGENTMGVMYNKSYFDEHGLTEPKTYDEFIALCEKIESLGDMDPLVVGAGDIWHLGFLFNQCWDDQVMSADPDFIKHCYEGTKTFTDPTVKAAINELAEIMQYAQKGWASTPDSQITTFLVNDMAAMLFSGTHMFPKIPQADPDFELGWFPLPSHDGKLRLVGGSGISGLAISSECAADPEKYAAAVDFLEFFYEPEVYGEYCTDMSVIPATKDSTYFKGLPLLMEVVKATSEADTLTPMWNAKAGTDELPPDFRNFTYKTVIEVLQGQRDLDTACEELQKAWTVGAKGFNPVTGEGM